jgi:hypothetical protein
MVVAGHLPAGDTIARHFAAQARHFPSGSRQMTAKYPLWGLQIFCELV